MYIPRLLTIGEIANGIGHHYILDQIAKKNEIGFVLEDDIVFKNNFRENLEKVMDIVPHDWEIITVGGDCDDGTGKYLYKSNKVNTDEITVEIPNKITSTVSCYILKPEIARKLAFCMKPFHFPSDAVMCYVLPYINPKIYWVHPYLAYEGSKDINFFKTSFTDREF